VKTWEAQLELGGLDLTRKDKKNQMCRVCGLHFQMGSALGRHIDNKHSDEWIEIRHASICNRKPEITLLPERIG